MNLQTIAQLPDPKYEYTHKHRFVCIGSCFATEIGTQLESNLFECLTNPLGTVFNPLALSELLIRAMEERGFASEEFFEHQELWRHFLVHSSLASTTLETSVEAANAALSTLREKLAQCDLLIVTLGSATVYHQHDASIPIGHNHKLPLSRFQKRRLSPEETTTSMQKALARIRQANPGLKACLTVSPIRHTRDGLHENNLSKACLLLALDALIQNDDSSDYFPSFEILLDELRDYRFYAEDLTHPNRQAIGYIWQCFRKTYFSQICETQVQEIESILKLLSHRAQHADTKAYQRYKADLLTKITALNQTIPKAGQLKEKWSQLP